MTGASIEVFMLTGRWRHSAGSIPGGSGTSAGLVMRLKGQRRGHFRAAIQRTGTRCLRRAWLASKAEEGRHSGKGPTQRASAALPYCFHDGRVWKQHSFDIQKGYNVQQVAGAPGTIRTSDPQIRSQSARAGGFSSTTFRATHPSARLSRRFNDLSINLFTSGQPSATVMGRPSSCLD